MDLETMFTSPDGFDVQGASPLQRAVCRVAWGIPIAELADHPDVIAGFGGPAAVAELPVGCVPAEMHIPGPSRSGKSKLMAADSLVAGQCVDVTGSELGDIVRVSILGLTTRTNAIWTHLCERVANQPALKRLLIGDLKDSVFALRHPTGRPIEYMNVPVDRWGGSVVSVYSGGSYVDEEPRQIGEESGVKNWDGVHDAVVGRLLPNAKFFGGGAPWAPQGPIFDLVNERFGKPGADMVIVRGTGPMWNPQWWTPERCVALERRNPTAYKSDVLAEFIDRVSGLLTADALRRVTRTDGRVDIPPEECGRYRAAGIDTSEAQEGGNGFSLCIFDGIIVENNGQRSLRGRVVCTREWRSGGPARALAEAAAICHRYGLKGALTDKFAGKANADLAIQHGLTLHSVRTTTEENVIVHSDFATRVATREIELSADPLLQRDLLGIRKHATQTGFRIEPPFTADGRHGDLGQACIDAWRALTLTVSQRVVAERKQRRIADIESQWSQLLGNYEVLGEGPDGGTLIRKDGQTFLQPAPERAPQTRKLIGHVKRYVGNGQYIDRAIYEGQTVFPDEILVPV
jgi:hypothetical protein